MKICPFEGESRLDERAAKLRIALCTNGRRVVNDHCDRAWQSSLNNKESICQSNHY